VNLLKKAEEPKKEEKPKRYAIRTGLYLIDERTGRRWAVLMCSDDQNSASWLEDEATIQDCRRVSCAHGGRAESHPLISLAEASELELLDIQEGSVNVPNGQIVAALLAAGEKAGVKGA
jgi:hypothetical protein